MTDYDDLADRGQLAPVSGTTLRSAAAADAARDALLAATGAESLEHAVTIARGRPRLDAEEATGPMGKVRATKPLDQKISQLAQRRSVSKPQILHEASAVHGGREGDGPVNGSQAEAVAKLEQLMVAEYRTGKHTVEELAEQYSVNRATVYRALDRAKAKGDGSLAL